MNNNYDFDVVVIGGGPAGVTAALRARELGAKTALVERGRMGGTCTNDGCVPTRALAKAARLLRDADQYADYGIFGEAPTLNFEKLMARVQEIVYRVHEKKQLIKHLETAQVDVSTETGDARFEDPHTIVTERGLRISGKKFILCVGGHARRLGFPGAELALTHSDVWSLKRLPKTVAIVGAAATGCQLASIFADFGSRVWLFDVAPNILPAEDTDVSKAAAHAFQQRGINIITGIEGIEQIQKSGNQLRLHYIYKGAPGLTQVEAVILAVGWPGNFEGLNLTAAGVESNKGFIPVNDYLQTNVAHIYAAGDITGRMMLVQSAGYEARIAASNAVIGPDESYGHYIVPHGGFTNPEYGSVGLIEDQARESDDIAVGAIPYHYLDRAVIDGYPQGFCKLIVSKNTHKILGAHVVGEQAVEIVQLVAAGMSSGIKIDQLAELELAYPTYTAIVGLAARKLMVKLASSTPSLQWRALNPTIFAEWERSELS